MQWYLIKRKIWKHLICLYYYNNEFILNLKRNHRKGSNVILLLTSPWLLLRGVVFATYESAIGKRRVTAIMNKEKNKHFPYEIAMVCISKNEGPYVKEWIEYHKMIGFSKFYFYDNESEDDTVDVLKPYIVEGLVEYTLIKGKGKQLEAYNDAIAKHKDECRWMAFLDMDEYLKPMQNPFEPIYELVNRLVEKVGNGAAGIGVNWAMFGSSHLEKKPEGLITENFIYRAEKDFWGCFHVKTICNPRLVKNYISPHYPLYITGGHSIDDTDGKRIWGWAWNDVKWGNIRINHYYCKSREQWIQKVSRGLGDREGSYDKTQFDKYDHNDVKDETMNVYKNALRKMVLGKE